MGPMGWTTKRGLLAVVLFLSGVLAVGVLLAGCGKSAGEKIAEEAIEKAAEEAGQNVDVDVENGSISISGDGADVSYQYGSDVEIPKEIPGSLIPDGAEVYFAGKAEEGEGLSYVVQFYSKTAGKEMLDFFVKELKKLGYEITGQYSAEQGGESLISVGAEKDGTEIACTGGSKTGNKFAYVVQIYLGGTDTTE
ncbi:MAG: hypothetical protein N3B14_04210 [Thermoleophilia bacterium]|nr:hypothetical protein [Thermoleophilia bacterium]